MGSNIAFSLDQFSNLIKQNEYLVKGLSKWFYSEDDYVVFTNKNNKTIDGLVEYDAKADDRIIYKNNITFNTSTDTIDFTIDYITKENEIIDIDNSIQANYKIKLENQTDYNTINVNDVINLKDSNNNIFYDFIVIDKLGLKTILVESNYYYKQTETIDISTIDTLSINTDIKLDTNSKLLFNIDLGEVIVNNNDILVIDNTEFIIDSYTYVNNKSIIIFKDYSTIINVDETKEAIIYYGDGNILSPKLLYKDLIYFPTMRLFSKFSNSNKSLLYLGDAGELLLQKHILLDTKIKGLNTDDIFKIFVKETITIFDKYSNDIKYNNLKNDYYIVYVRVNTTNTVNNFKFNLDIEIAPLSENKENIGYIPIGGFYIEDNNIKGLWDINNKSNLTIDELKYIIANYNTYPIKIQDFWILQFDIINITDINTKYKYILNNFKMPDFTEASMLVNELGNIYYGVEYIDNNKYYSIITNDSNENVIKKYSPEFINTIQGNIKIVCIL